MTDEDRTWGIGYLVVIVIGIGAYTYWAGGIKTVWYAAMYDIATDKVRVDAQPSDCDFMHAPLGQKGCHYESTVIAYNAAGEVVGGDAAPKYGHDVKTGKPILSWDNGKTWIWYPGPEVPDPKVKSVVVSWIKVED